MTQNNVINLNRVRKQRARAEKAAKGTENAVKFGRTKVQRALEETLTNKARDQVDVHKLDPDTPEA